MNEPNRTSDDDTTSEDLKRWHREDVPHCPVDGRWIVGPPGFRCTICDWWCKVG